jgi:hypothetical protein
MQYTPTAYIEFPANERRGKKAMRRITGCVIEQGWDLLTDRAELTLPRNIREFNEDGGVKGLFKRGDKVIINLGVDGNNEQEFIGYLSSVGADIPVRFECEDSMYLLKRHPVNLTYTGNLSGLLQKILPSGMEYEASNIKLERLRFPKTTASKVLEWLKDNYGIYSYFVGEKLISGKIYLDNAERVKLDFSVNIKLNSDLKYVRADEMKLKVTVKSIRPDSSNVSVTVGDSDGEESSFEYWGNHTEEECREIAILNLERLKVDGYSGTLRTWGIPRITHGTILEINHPLYPERNGDHYADRVVKVWEPSFYEHQTKVGKAA